MVGFGKVATSGKGKGRKEGERRKGGKRLLKTQSHNSLKCPKEGRYFMKFQTLGLNN